MKKLLKPEIEFVKFENADVITTSFVFFSLGDEIFASEQEFLEAQERQQSEEYGNGNNSLWNDDN